MEFGFYLATQIIFGEGTRFKLGEQIKCLKIQHPLVVTDTFLKSTEWGKDIIKQLENHTIYDGVIPNPTCASVDECVKKYKENGCDGIIVFGGGSAIDTAKGCAAIVGGNSSVRDYLDGCGEHKWEIKDCPPIIAIPSTAGTGSEVSQYAVITDEKTKIKDSISSGEIYPKIAIIDPEVTWSLPNEMTIATGLDVLSHALESLTSTINNPITDLLAIEAIGLVFDHLPQCLEQGAKEAREKMAYASMLAGIAMSHCCGTLPHSMGCPLSGHCSVPHGLAVGVLQIPTLEIIGSKCHIQLNRLMQRLDSSFVPQNEESSVNAVIQKIHDLFHELDCPEDLEEYDLSEEKIKLMVQDAFVHGCTKLTPVRISKEQIEHLYFQLQ